MTGQENYALKTLENAGKIDTYNKLRSSLNKDLYESTQRKLPKITEAIRETIRNMPAEQCFRHEIGIDPAPSLIRDVVRGLRRRIELLAM